MTGIRNFSSTSQQAKQFSAYRVIRVPVFIGTRCLSGRDVALTKLEQVETIISVRCLTSIQRTRISTTGSLPLSKERSQETKQAIKSK